MFLILIYIIMLTSEVILFLDLKKYITQEEKSAS